MSLDTVIAQLIAPSSAQFRSISSKLYKEIYNNWALDGAGSVIVASSRKNTRKESALSTHLNSGPYKNHME